MTPHLVRPTTRALALALFAQGLAMVRDPWVFGAHPVEWLRYLGDTSHFTVA